MKLWSYPVGAIVNMGQPLIERSVFFALPFTINDISYGPDIFSKWPFADIAALGIKLFTEDTVPQFYIAGDPFDVETDTTITRTYPNAVPDEDAILNSQMVAIGTEYEAKLATVQNSIITTIASDGVDMETRLSERRADYQRILAARSAAIDALWGEE